MRTRALHFFLLALALVSLAVPSAVLAAPRVVVSAASGQPRPPLVLAPHEGGYAADFVITNAGDAPLVVSRIAIRGDEDDPRSPARVSVRFADGAPTSATIAPGASKTATVRWMPERDPRTKQALGHAIVTSNDEASGEIAIGFRARVPTPLAFIADHVLSWIVFLPLAGVLVAFALRVADRPSDRAMRAVAITIGAAELALSFVALTRFAPSLGRADGNDGFQLVDRAVWVRPLGVEYYVGVDGTSISLVVLVALLAFVVVLASFGVERRAAGYYAVLLLLVAGMMGVVVSLDLVPLFASWELVLVAACLLVGLWGESSRRTIAAAKLGLFGLVASVIIAFAFLALHTNSDRAFLVDGTTARHVSAIPELARVAFATKHLVLFGMPFDRVVWVALVVAFGVGLPIFPLHTWLPDALAEAPAPVAAILGGAVLPLAPYALLRTGLVVLPEASRWGAAALVSFGVVTIVYGALCALAQRDLRRIVAYGSMSHMGLCFVGLGALTPQGIAGALTQMTTHGAATALLFFLVGALEDRTGVRDVTRFGGLMREAPRWSTLLGVALFAWIGVPGLACFWGSLLVIAGAFPTWPAHALIALLGGLLGAACAAWTLQRLCAGAPNAEWRASPRLEPFSGKIPDLDARELACAAPLVAVVIILGAWPVPLLSTMASGVRDVLVRLNAAGPDPLALIP